MYPTVQQQDPELYAALENEGMRQRNKLELIASENYVSRAVLEAQGSLLTNKYAEGYPGKRYYGGCEYVDVAEELARDRIKQLFGAEYANVQPHSGSGANMAVYYTYLKNGATVLGMDLSQGGHLTHGSPVNFSGKQYNFIPYGIDPATGLIDYNKVEELAMQHRPAMITVGASAYSRNIDYAAFRVIADKCGAFLFADIAHPAGLIARGLLNSPIQHCDVVASTTHKTLRGPRGGIILLGKDVENPFGAVAPKSGRTKMMSELIDSMVMPGIQGGPLMHVIAAKAAAFREALSEEFGVYARKVIENAAALAQELMNRDYNIISGGTDNHLMLIDLRNKALSGKKAEAALDAAGITVNKNSVPFDDKSPLVTSGIRIGAAAVTTRGMQSSHMKQIAAFIDRVLSAPDDESVLAGVKSEVAELCSPLPIHAEISHSAVSAASAD